MDKGEKANPLIADTMYLNGFIEKIGSGTEDIVKQSISYGLKEPVFQQGYVFKVTIWRPEEVNGRRKPYSYGTNNTCNDTSNITRNVTIVPSKEVLMILLTADRLPSSRKDLLIAAGLSNQAKNIKRHINPLIEGGYLKPIANLTKNQKKPLLSITDKGIRYLNELRLEK